MPSVPSVPSVPSGSCSPVLRRRGISLLEVIGVLVAAVILISGAMALAHRAYNDVRVNEAVAALPALAELVREVGAEFGGAYPEEALLQEIFYTPTAPNLPAGSDIGRVAPHGIGLAVAGSGAQDSDYTLSHRVGAAGGRVQIAGVHNTATVASGLGAWFYISYTQLRQPDCLRLLLESPTHPRSGLLGVIVSGTYNETDLRTALKEMIANREDLSELSVAAGAAQFLPASLPAASSRFVGTGARPTHFGNESEVLLPVSPVTAEQVCARDGLTITWAFI